jgi:1-acyl-sn-glycerol-3-phosphate acyltransferase
MTADEIAFYSANGRGPLRPTLVYRATIRWTRPLARLLFRPAVTGAERVPDEGGFVLCANHLSGFDSPALAQPLHRRWVLQMAKPQLFAQRGVGTFVRWFGAFPARSATATRASVGTAAALAQQGFAVLILPEGARRRGRRLRPRTGAARVALAAGVPVVPAAVKGTDGWRRLERWRVVFGDPIVLDDLADLEPHLAARQATERIWAEILRLEATLG